MYRLLVISVIIAAITGASQVQANRLYYNGNDEDTTAPTSTYVPPPQDTTNCSGIPAEYCKPPNGNFTFCAWNFTSEKCALRYCVSESDPSRCFKENSFCFWNSSAGKFNVTTRNFPCQVTPCPYYLDYAACSFVVDPGTGKLMCDYMNGFCQLRCSAFTEKQVCNAAGASGDYQCRWSESSNKCLINCDSYTNLRDCPVAWHDCWIPFAGPMGPKPRCRNECRSHANELACAVDDSRACFWDGRRCVNQCLFNNGYLPNPQEQTQCMNDPLCELTADKRYCVNRVCAFSNMTACVAQKKTCVWNVVLKDCFISPCAASTQAICNAITASGKQHCRWSTTDSACFMAP